MRTGLADPFLEGQAAYAAGRWLQDNPYPHSSSPDHYCPFRAWRDGWFAADNAAHGESEESTHAAH